MNLSCQWRLLASCVLALCLLPAGALAGAEYIGPDGGHVSAVAVSPFDADLLYAAGVGGVFKSTDAGASWSRCTGGMPKNGWGQSITGFAFVPGSADTCYMAVYGDAVYKTVNGGATWARLSTSVNPYDVRGVSSSQAVYAWNAYSGLFRSADGGQNWSLLVAPPNDPIFTAFTVDAHSDDRLYLGGSYGACVYKSVDAGSTWSVISSGIASDTYVSGIASDPNVAGLLYLGTDAGFYKSVDYGEHWTELQSGGSHLTYISSIVFNKDAPGTLYIASSRAYRSTDSGATWTQVSSVDDVHSLAAPAASGVLYAGYDRRGLLKSTNGGTSLVASQAGYRSHGVNAVAVDAAGRLYATTEKGNVFRRATDWTELIGYGSTSSRFSERVFAAAGQAGKIYVGGLNTGLRRSADSGDSWTSIKPGSDTVQAFALSGTAGELYVATGNQGAIYHSSDDGASWSLRSAGVDGGGFAYANTMLVDPTNAQVLYLSTFQGLFKSADGGTSWSLARSGSHEGLAMADDSGALFVVANQANVVRSTDGGSTWQTVLSDAGTLQCVAVRPGRPDEVIVGGNGVLLRSRDGGATWEDISGGLTMFVAYSIGFDPGDATGMFIGTRAGVLHLGGASLVPMLLPLLLQ